VTTLESTPPAGRVEEAADPNPPDATDIGAVEAVADPSARAG